MNPDAAEAAGVQARLWDFLFYASVRVRRHPIGLDGGRAARVLLPDRAVGGRDAVRAKRSGPRLAIGWTMGTVVSALGVWLSLQLDLPTGATIVCTFGLVLILMAIARVIIPRKAPFADNRAHELSPLRHGNRRQGHRLLPVRRRHQRPGASARRRAVPPGASPAAVALVLLVLLALFLATRDGRLSSLTGALWHHLRTRDVHRALAVRVIRRR